jgi:hypothetical protein
MKNGANPKRRICWPWDVTPFEKNHLSIFERERANWEKSMILHHEVFIVREQHFKVREGICSLGWLRMSTARAEGVFKASMCLGFQFNEGVLILCLKRECLSHSIIPWLTVDRVLLFSSLEMDMGYRLSKKGPVLFNTWLVYVLAYVPNISNQVFFHEVCLVDNKE